MSLYRHFASKDDLILACFDRQRNDFWRKWEAHIAKHPNNPRAQIMQFFNDLANAACASGYRGCCFINVAVEFPNPAHPARKLVFDHEKMLIQKIAEVTSALGVSDPKRLGLTLALLIQGTYAASQTFGTGSEPVRIVPDIVEKLLDDAL
jgi:AcrR family transcriptional regulator